jgi:hypothetical protein
MGYFFNTSDINQTFIIEPLSLTGGAPTVSACTAVFTNNVVSCDYNTTIFLGDGIINFDGNLYTNDNLTASTINASTYYSGGTNLFDIINQNGIVGGSFSNSADTLTLIKADNSKIYVTGFTDYYTTGATLIGNTIYFDRNDTLSAYTVNLSKYTADTYVTGVSFTNNQIIITRNDNFSTGAFINTMTGLTINGLLTSSNISATTISTISLNSDSITALTLTSNTINSNNINAQTISATTYYGDGSNLSGVKYTGGTVTGNTLFQGVITASTLIVTGSTILNTLTANTISATTYQNLPVSGLTEGSNISITGSNGNYTVSFTGGNVNYPTIFNDGLSGNTISATTITATNYNNLPLDVKVTGFTYSSNTFIVYDNSGQTFPATFNVVTGLTVNGGLTATTIYGNGSNITNIQIVNVDNLQSQLANKFDKSGGTVSGNVLVTGNVTILGTATTINTDTLNVKDNIITLNSNATGNTVPYPINSGIEILRNSATTATLLWNETSGYWMAGLTGSSKQIILSGDSLSLLNSGHTHPISEIVDLQEELVKKFDASGGTINGNFNVTGNTTLNTLTATTISAATYSGNVLTSVSANTGIGQNNNTIFTLYNTNLSGGIQMTSAVGGLSAGTAVSSLTSNTIVQLLDTILFPTANPTYTIPTITLTGVTTQTLQVGTTYSPTIGLYGIKNDAGPFTQLSIIRSGATISTTSSPITSLTSSLSSEYGYADPNNPNYKYDISPYSDSYVIPSPVGSNTSTSTSYYGSGNYGSGLPKYDSKGNFDARALSVRNTNAPQLSANSFTTSTYTITGIYPYFYGKMATLPTNQSIADAISGGTALSGLSSASGTLTIPYNTSPTGEYIWVAYFQNYTTKTVWYVSALDTGSIDGSFITTATTQSVKSPSNYWSGVNFKMHWSVNATIQTTLEFRNS